MQNLRAAEVWRAVQSINPCTAMSIEASTDRESKQANTATEKEDMLRRTAFRPNDDDQQFKLPPAARAHTPFTKQAVKRAL